MLTMFFTEMLSTGLLGMHCNNNINKQLITLQNMLENYTIKQQCFHSLFFRGSSKITEAISILYPSGKVYVKRF